MIIDDGTGRGFSAQVDAENRLSTQALTETQVVHHAHEGNVFAFPVAPYQLTTLATWHGLFYMKNTSTERNVYIDLLRVTSTEKCDYQIIKQPTTGTLITAGTNVSPVVTRFDSGNTFDGLFKVGTDGSTITDGTVMCATAGQTMCGTDIDGIIILTPNTSLAITARPSASTYVAVTMMGFVSAPQHG